MITGDVGFWESRLRLRDLEKQLSDFMESLPSEMQWTTDNLLLRAYTPNLTRFVMLHSFWHQSHCDLYRLPIRGIKESVSDRILAETPPDYARLLRERCLDFAFDLAKMLSQVLELDLDDPVKDLSIAACAYQCAKIVVVGKHGNWSNLGSQSMCAENAVDVCLRVLDHLKEVYPMAKAVVRAALTLS